MKNTPRVEGEEPGINLEKTARLVRDEFRFESAVSPDHPWPPESSIRPIILNYADLLSRVAEEQKEAGEADNARRTLGRAIEILEFHGRDEKAAEMRERRKVLGN